MHTHAAVRCWAGGGSGVHTRLSQLHISPPMLAAVLPNGRPSTSTDTDEPSSADGASRPYTLAFALAWRRVGVAAHPVGVATQRVAKQPLLGCFKPSEVCIAASWYAKHGT